MKKRIKVCHITTSHPRYDTRIFRKECCTLAKAGYDVSLIIGSDTGNEETVEDIKIYPIGHDSNGKLSKIISRSRKIYKKALEIDADIYHVHEISLLRILLKLKKLGKKVILDIHEDPEYDMRHHPWVPYFLRPLFFKLYLLYEHHSFKQLDAILTVTPHVTDRIKLINKQTFEINNFPMIMNIDRDRDNINNRNICFGGQISDWYSHINIINAIQKIDGAHYLLAGNVKDEYLSTLKKLDGWSKVCFYGKIPYSDVLEIYSRSNLGISMYKYTPGDTVHLGTMGVNKIFEFMMAGLPVLCTDFVLWKDVVEGHQCGICTDPNDEESIRNAIEFIFNNPEEAKKMGDNGRKAALTHYNWDNNLAIQFLEIYKGLHS